MTTKQIEEILQKKQSRMDPTEKIALRDFAANVQEGKLTIRAGSFPVHTGAGTSGSYFVLDRSGERIAIFKPRDEEPFADNNPNWSKCLQRLFCCCCFGRSVLPPDTGYLAETGASIVDERLMLNIVPTTRIVELTSPTFHYGRGCCGRVIEPRAKEGSYQIYVKGYRHAQDVLDQWNATGLNMALTLAELRAFTVEFQKMCLLDYLIRNTDRHMENWLIKHVPNQTLRIAAIDNGLSFPVRHPEHENVFRRYPFDWSTLSWAYKPWDETLRERLLALMTPLFIHELCQDLKKLFTRGPLQNRLSVQGQIRVFRGQAWNLRLSLIAHESPWAMVQRKPVLVRRKYSNGVPPSKVWEECFLVLPDDACCAKSTMCSIM